MALTPMVLDEITEGIVTQSISFNVQYNASIDGTASVNAAKTGHTLLGVVGISMSNNTNNYINGYTVNSANSTVTVYGSRANRQTFDGSATGSLVALYRKN